jgi:hypothetical protein
MNWLLRRIVVTLEDGSEAYDEYKYEVPSSENGNWIQDLIVVQALVATNYDQEQNIED